MISRRHLKLLCLCGLLSATAARGSDNVLGAPAFDHATETTYRAVTWDDFKGKGSRPPEWNRWQQGSFAHIATTLRVNPGDRITFVVPVYADRTARTPTDPAEVDEDVADAVAGPTIEIGPFRVKSLGDRLGTRDVMKASRRAPIQERQIGIVVDITKPEEVERAKRLRDRLATGDYRNIGIILHASK